MKETVTIYWMRRDLRLEDNTALNAALRENEGVLPLFIFDENILQELEPNDPRVNFIYETLENIHEQITLSGSGIHVIKGVPLRIFEELTREFEINAVYTAGDYEPYAVERDQEVQSFLESKQIAFHVVKDQVVFEKDEVVKDDGKPYTVFTPYKNRWLKKLQESPITIDKEGDLTRLFQKKRTFPKKSELGILPSTIHVQPFDLRGIQTYHESRDIPSLNGTSKLGPHLRFGTVSIRKIVLTAQAKSSVFLSELIWREFFMQILWHFPHVVHKNFRSKYDGIQWRNDAGEFEKWCKGETGYPMVDAGMRELNETGTMHNRVRMITAGFLCKHLLIDWRWGEAYFAQKLLDYELASNNGNWQWAAGTGCDAAPYFRVFNPTEQLKKFDPQMQYCKKWIPELLSGRYSPPMVEHSKARLRAIETYKKGIRS